MCGSLLLLLHYNIEVNFRCKYFCCINVAGFTHHKLNLHGRISTEISSLFYKLL